MSSSDNTNPSVFLSDGTTNSDLVGCTLVFPAEELAPSITFRETYNLHHLVRWAIDRGYSTVDLTLTVSWNRRDLEERFGWRISDADWLDAQRWLDEASGGFACATVCHVWEDIAEELQRRFKAGHVPVDNIPKVGFRSPRQF